MEADKTIARICRATALTDDAIVSIFPYGSRVYGTDGPASDHDFVVVADGCRDGHEVRSGDFNIHTYTIGGFEDRLARHKITALECVSVPEDRLLLARRHWHPVIEKSSLRAEISGKASHSWVKAKKKLTVEQDTVSGLKSLFHALRIIEFGVQLAERGRIVDFGAANPIWWEIRASAPDWDALAARWKPHYNERLSAFRQLAPKQD